MTRSLPALVADADMARRLATVARFLDVPRSTVGRYWTDWARDVPWDRGANVELYLLVRALLPRTVVETGVNRGWSSAAILRALDHNDWGRLVSLDLPNHDARGFIDKGGRRDGAFVPHGATGCEVPTFLRGRWDLRFGDAVDLLDGVPPFQLFYHDSDHSYEHQFVEYSFALRHLGPRGLLVSDDIDRSTAFGDITRRHRSFRWPRLARTRGAAWA